MGESGSALALEGEGSLLLPLSGSASASIFPGAEHMAGCTESARGAASPAGHL